MTPELKSIFLRASNFMVAGWFSGCCSAISVAAPTREACQEAELYFESLFFSPGEDRQAYWVAPALPRTPEACAYRAKLLRAVAEEDQDTIAQYRIAIRKFNDLED